MKIPIEQTLLPLPEWIEVGLPIMVSNIKV